MAVTSVRAGGDFQTIEGVQSAIHEKRSYRASSLPRVGDNGVRTKHPNILMMETCGLNFNNNGTLKHLKSVNDGNERTLAGFDELGWVGGLDEHNKLARRQR